MTFAKQQNEKQANIILQIKKWTSREKQAHAFSSISTIESLTIGPYSSPQKHLKAQRLQTLSDFVYPLVCTDIISNRDYNFFPHLCENT